MSFRTVFITGQTKLNYKNNFLLVKKENDEKYIHLTEIDTIVVDSLSTTISSYLLKEIASNKINIIFCDEKHNPFGELQSYYSKHNSSKKIAEQISWESNQKEKIWKNIVKNKIINQAFLLHSIQSEKYELLLDYKNDVQLDDKTNREGHAAKVYFNELFSKDFNRKTDDKINTMLNYGYSILLSTVNKEVVNNGYVTQVGIHHKNEFNDFNLSCDLMEPFRPLIDSFVYDNSHKEFNKNFKIDILDLFNKKYNYLNKEYTLKDVIKIYVKLTLDCLSTNNEYQDFIYYEE